MKRKESEKTSGQQYRFKEEIVVEMRDVEAEMEERLIGREEECGRRRER